MGVPGIRVRVGKCDQDGIGDLPAAHAVQGRHQLRTGDVAVRVEPGFVRPHQPAPEDGVADGPGPRVLLRDIAKPEGESILQGESGLNLYDLVRSGVLRFLGGVGRLRLHDSEPVRLLPGGGRHVRQRLHTEGSAC